MRLLQTHLAIVCLLVQAVLGAAGPMAVLCMGGDACSCSMMARAANTQRARASCCCSDETGASPKLTVSLPCGEPCDACIEIDLPDDALAVSGKALEAKASMIDFDLVAQPLLALQLDDFRGAGPRKAIGVSPPGVRSFPHAAVIRSTRLLI